MIRDNDAPLNAINDGRLGPKIRYNRKIKAVILNAGPITRRQASNKRMMKHSPIIISDNKGCPERNTIEAGSSSKCRRQKTVIPIKQALMIFCFRPMLEDENSPIVLFFLLKKEYKLKVKIRAKPRWTTRTMRVSKISQLTVDS